MRRIPIHVALVFTLFAAIAPLASAATTTYNGPLLFTLPSKTPKTEVACNTCSPGDMGKKSVGYQGAISTFVGRYNDSALDSEGFSLPRPLRAWQMKYDSVHDRMYIRVGSFLVAYDVPMLLSRLQAGEALITIERPGDVGPAGSYLNWDKYFNIEDNWPQSGMDGGDWLPDFDFDDRGAVWLTEGVAWGSVKDDFTRGGLFTDNGYRFPAPASGSARSIVTIKTADGRYWVGVSPETSTTAIYDVSDRANPLPGGVLQRGFVKTSTAKSADNHWLAIVNAGTNAVEIFTAEDFVFGRGPTFTAGGGRSFKGVTTDGTNFYSAESVNGKLSISKFTQTGGGFSEQTTPTTHSFLPEHIKYGAGYLSVNGLNPTNSTNDIYVFRAGNGTMTELDLNSYASTSSLKTDRYFPSYYSTNGVPTGFLSTIYSLIFDSFVIQKNGHTYMFVNAKGFGDVYEIKGSDSIAAQNKGITGTPNPNSTQTGSGPYYGDKLVFGSTTSAPAAMNVNWNFGNPESTDNSASSVTGRDVIHQFSGITSTSQLSGQRTVSVTAASDASIFDQQFVTLAVPTARTGIAGQPILFTLPNASSSAAIVTSDQWFDGSDGTVEGHFSSWNIDGSTTKGIPTATVPVGTCGSHSLIFTANYGPYTGSGSTLTSSNGALAQSINSINYLSRPFVAIVNGPAANPNDSSKVMFTNGSRSTSNTGDLPAGATFTWQWDLLNSGGTSLQTATGSATLSQIPAFNVDKSTFTGLTGAKVRLQLSTAATLGANCSATSNGTTGALSAPDPVVNIVSGCQYTGGPCNLSVTSGSGADTSAWNVSWSFAQPGPVGGTGLTLSPSFSSTYSGNVTVQVTNAIGSGNASKSLSIATPPCNTIPTVGDFVVQWFGNTSNNCFSPSGTCGNGEVITFAVTTSAYHWSTTCDTYLWTFGDGQTASGRTVTHTYPNGTATYQGKFELTVGTTVLTFPFTVKIGTTSTGGGGGGCGNNCPTCPQIGADSAFVSYSGGASGCTYANTNITCQTGESVQLAAVANFYTGYNFNCGSHSFSWNFGDGQSASGQNVAHTYAAAGSYTAQVTINSPTGTMIYSVPVPVGGSTSCAAPTTANVGIGLAGGTSGCTANNPNCRANENITFTVNPFAGYSLTACAHSYTWDFGDGSDPVSGSNQSVTHSYTGSQPQYTVRVTVTNQSGSIQLQKIFNVSTSTGGGSCAVPTSDLIFLTYSAPSGCTVYSPAVACSANEAVSFQANPNTFNHYNFNCGTHSFAWDFGDGSTGSGVNPTHTFAAGGTFTVKCLVTNPSGSVSLPMTINVTATTGGGGGATVSFGYEPDSSNLKLIKFTPSVIPPNSVTSWKWNFGDNTPEISYGGTSTSPQYHLYTNSGTYTVTLTTNVGVVTKQVMVAVSPRSRPIRH